MVLSCAGAEIATWAITDWDRSDLAIVDTLARLQLFASRLGGRIEVRDVCPELAGLLDLVGLADLLAGREGLRLEVGGEAEGGEQVGVKEVVMPDDPVA